MAPRKHEPSGQRFGRWTAISEAPKRGKSRVWNCICDCGTQKEVWLEALVSGKSTSCDCFRLERLRETLTTHGMSDAPEFQAWAQMLDRCGNPANRSFDHYGGRGISVYPAWKSSFSEFLKDMGLRPSSKHSLERNDNDGNYEPGNCRWATRLEQARNTSRTVKIECDGVFRTLAEWSYFSGLPETAIRSRLRRGWSVWRAVSHPLKLAPIENAGAENER